MSKPANQPPAPTPAPTPTPEPEPTPAPDPKPEPAPAATGKTYTEAELEAQKKKWEKDWQKKVDDADKKAKMSEDEKLKAERDDALKQLRERDTRDEVTAAAEKAGVRNAKLFYNAYKDELEFDDKGKITNLKDVLDAAKTEAPELFGAPSPQPQGGADAGDGKGTPEGLTLEKINAMSEKEIAANMDAIDKFFASQK